MHFGIDPGTSISLAQSSGMSPKPTPRATVAGNVDVRSRVVVKMTLTTSSWANSFRPIKTRNSSCVALSIAAGVSSSHVVAPRRPRNCADLM
jgi:hypothetical protein